jgi:hypothetical protein
MICSMHWHVASFGQICSVFLQHIYPIYNASTAKESPTYSHIFLLKLQTATSVWMNIPSKHITLDLMETSDLFFRRGCLNWNTSYRKMERIKVVEKLQIYKFRSLHFWYMIHPKKLQNSQKNLKFSWGPMLEAFTVYRRTCRQIQHFSSN